ncbi:sporulation protein [Novipirellula artificiosorum]|uniref:Arrestin-like N-terminal domain-containing protein n=1 Tax=Novipirellula artificiosorum TaxID=2528016 RepID=A0A5C6E0L8_9BACT|nr:sporulation protein [Novipirellula artificiosorum]TWU40709.1 hypothetical protein Poly41_15440 [Novipirellula artificiosorum]
MAKCDLSIELEQDPGFLHQGGETLRGKVVVRVDSDVKCNGLVVESAWRTHGRGNVAKGTSESKTLYEGEWTAGQVQEYPFELRIADWPPSYHGHFLNVDHYVDARAKIPWSIDPKASVPFLMRPTCGTETATATTKTTQVNGIIGGCVVLVAMSIFASVFMVAAASIIPLFFFGFIAMLGFGFYAIRVWLPKYLLGDVLCDFASTTVTPGDQASGELIVRPRKNVAINGITMKFSAREECVSGSGSNRKTHRHPFYETTEHLQASTTLAAGKEHRFPLSVSLPGDAPYSIDVSDNKLIWSTEIRIDIPRWPDWRQETALQVLPSGDPAARHSGPQPTAPSRSETDSITFAETAAHLWAVRDEPTQRGMLVDAVTGLSFQLAARIERRLLYTGHEDPHVFADGYAVWAHCDDPPLPLVLYVPHALADEFEQIGRELWQGRGTLLGWDDRHNRLQIRVEV